ncbi:MAG: hypothetical protein M3N98_07260 [Actinomycetota bacterium]|nr:hypothetical protein [Actinomycetota bacterium]
MTDADMTTVSAVEADAASTGDDRDRAVAAMAAQLAATPRAMFPYQHAAIAYRLGLAYAESAGADPTDGLRKALACYDLAAAIFDPRFDPVPHARVLNAAGAAQRALGDRRRAADLFQTAADLLADHGRDDERAAALNNLGLVMTELGESDQAVAACDEAAKLFDAESEQGRRGRVAALHGRGLAHAAMGGEAGLTAALDDYEQALAALDAREAPYHYGIVNDSIGVACIALAGLVADEQGQLLSQAAQAFFEALTVFTRTAFPYQYALVKHNLGLALLGLGTLAVGDSLKDLRWSLSCFEDTVAVLDPRLHAAEWQRAYTNLERANDELVARGAHGTRTEHFAALLAGCSDTTRLDLLRERTTRLLTMPDPQRGSVLTELALASAALGYDAALPVATTELIVLMELPREHLEVGLRARFNAHRLLDESDRQEADRALDQAIGDALGGPQRMYVRDFLYSLGWERP